MTDPSRQGRGARPLLREDSVVDITTEIRDTSVSICLDDRRGNPVAEEDVTQRCSDKDSRASALADLTVGSRASALTEPDGASVSPNGDEHHDMCGCDVCMEPAYVEYSADEIAHFYSQGLRYSQGFGWHRDSGADFRWRTDSGMRKGVVFLNSAED